jgi:4-diphosphocytidyl-2-C-methyl-D-erythritol kinase
VPHAAGLGGGSADAAAVLRTLNDLWGCGLSKGELTELGAGLGSDVPALLDGGAVLARGRGEDVVPVDAGAFWWVVVTPGVRVATADAFRWWDEDGGPTGPDPAPVIEAARRGDARSLARSLFNDLQDAVVRRHPEVEQARRRLLAGGALATVMSGSGPSVAGLFVGPPAVDVPGGTVVTSIPRTASGSPAE